MEMKKIISEEIENMKYLLGYKRGIVVSEQSTPVTAPASATAPTTAAPSTAPVTPSTETTQPIKMGVKNPRVQVLQQLLNDKFQSGLVADGLYGPKTANAIYKNIVAINKLQLKPVESDLKPAETTQQPAPQINAPQIPTAATPK
jgi:peptidoglycan hydrolase-like protein with peptidoglycan-binding domain